jgi:thioesterase domain-containing protein/acyl carrier protein
VDIAAAVDRAWKLALNQQTPQPDRSWEDSGGESIKALHLLFEIEETLNVQIPMDLLEPHFTARDLTNKLARVLKNAPAASAKVSEPDKPTVFLFPAYDGDTPILVRFRSAFEDRVRFQVIRYPSWDELIASKASFESIVRAALDQVMKGAESGDVAFLGYSFGGLVAAQVSDRIASSGRRVSYLGIIDTMLYEIDASQSGKASNMVSRLRATPGRKTVILIESAVRHLARRSAFGLLGLLGRAAERMPSRARFLVHRALAEQLRRFSSANWSFHLLTCPATLFRAETSLCPEDDYGWRPLCRDLTIVDVAGADHITILEKPYNQLLCEDVIQRPRGPVHQDVEVGLLA